MQRRVAPSPSCHNEKGCPVTQQSRPATSRQYRRCTSTHSAVHSLLHADSLAHMSVNHFKLFNALKNIVNGQYHMSVPRSSGSVAIQLMCPPNISLSVLSHFIATGNASGSLGVFFWISTSTHKVSASAKAKIPQ